MKEHEKNELHFWADLPKDTEPVDSRNQVFNNDTSDQDEIKIQKVELKEKDNKKIIEIKEEELDNDQKKYEVYDENFKKVIEKQEKDFKKNPQKKEYFESVLKSK